MDGPQGFCAQCGASLGVGRYCTNCGAPVGSVPPTARQPAYDVPPAPPPVAPAAPPTAAPQAPPPAAPVAPPPRRREPIGLWIGAAAVLVVVMLLGAYLLLHGTGGSSSSATPPLIPTTHHTPAATHTKATHSPSPSATTSQAPHGPAVDVAGLARASAPAHAPAAVDFAGHPVTYLAANMVDGAADTCWRRTGNATGTVLTFRLDRPTQITKVGLINGYAKTAYSHGRAYDWYQGDRRVLAVEWIFDNGSRVSQTFSDTRAMQTKQVPPVTTSTVRVLITAVSPPGRGPASRNNTAISEVSLVGRSA